MKKSVFTIALLLGLTSLSYSQENRKEQKPPTIEELFAQLDTNKDAKLSKKEVKGPLKKDFEKIDLNKDGFLTKAELEKAPKPDGQRPPKGQSEKPSR